jgi:hypothetical protein
VKAAAIADMPVFIRRAHNAGAVVLPYAGWLGHGNVGDDILFDILCRLIAECLGSQTVDFVQCAETTMPAIDWAVAAGAILGGGSTIDPYYINMITPALARDLPTFCFAAGYQKDAAMTKAERASIARLCGAQFGCLRGEATRQIVREIAGVDHLPALIDGGYLAPHFLGGKNWPPDIAAFLADTICRGRQVVTMTMFEVGNIRQLLVDFMNANADHYDFVLLPFDPATLRGLQHLRDSAGPACVAHLETDYQDYRRLLAWFDVAQFSINMKLHASVLSSAAGTPPIALGGGRKFAEYFDSIDSGALHVPAFEKLSLPHAVAHAQDLKPPFARTARTRLATALAAHRNCIAAFLQTDRIQARLSHLGEHLTVTGLTAPDHGIVLISAREKEGQGSALDPLGP